MKKFSTGVFLNITTPDKNLWIQQIEFIKTLNNVEHIEIWLEYLPSTQQELEFLKEITKGYRIIIHAPFMSLYLLSPHENIYKSVIEVFTKTADIGNNLNACGMTVHLDSYPFFWDKQTAQEEAIKRINLLVNNINIPVGIENLSISKGTLISYPSTHEELRELSLLLPKKAFVTIDTGHFLKDGIDCISPILDSQNLFDIHLHDGKPGKAHLNLGEGILDSKKLIKTLIEKKYDKFLSLEVIGESDIRSSWTYLQNILKAF